MEKQKNILKTTLQTLIREGFNPIVVLTMVDEENENIRSDPLGTYQDIEEIRLKLNEFLGIPENRILCCVNYQSETKRVFEIDRGIFKTIQLAVQMAMVKSETDKTPPKWTFDD